jgi:hypothetical protein
MINLIKFSKYFMNCGHTTYPYLFEISIVLYLVDIIQLCMHKENGWTILALVLYTIWFLGIFIECLFKYKKENYGKYY